MCGIVGFFEPGGTDLALKAGLMAAQLKHRGPDDNGVWAKKEIGLAFAHTRLSIVDLSPLGHQPMQSASRRYTITFNGEVYNFKELRKELEQCGVTFRGNSDTEVMLEAFEQWGVEHATKRFIGMFAFAVWDEEEQLLFLVRDRLGKKPLYYGWCGDVFFFSSEVTALRPHPAFNADVDRNALSLMLRLGYVPAPFSIYRGIFKVRPGSIIPFTLRQLSARPGTPDNPAERPIIYWSIKEKIEEERLSKFRGTLDNAVNEFESLLSDSVRLRMIADVPIGSFLSGGLDSSLVTSIMQRESSKPVRTFSIGFREAGYDEAPHARKIAEVIGTDHTEFYLDQDEARAAVPELGALSDEPFGDASLLPSFLVARLARKNVTVCLTGDGGDELFGGYTRYPWAVALYTAISPLPHALRTLASAAMLNIPASAWNGFFGLLNQVTGNSPFLSRSPAEKVYRAAELLGKRSLSELYQRMLSFHSSEEELVLGSRNVTGSLISSRQTPSGLNKFELLMFLDSVSYLPDDILTKVDRATMRVALESRVPLLDHRIVEFAWSLPISYRRTLWTSKVLIRKLLARHIPEKLFDRPKMGFGIPLHAWLRGELREWAEDHLSIERLSSDGFLNTERVQSIWKEFIDGKSSLHGGLLWNILMFQAWNRSREL